MNYSQRGQWEWVSVNTLMDRATDDLLAAVLKISLNTRNENLPLSARCKKKPFTQGSLEKSTGCDSMKELEVVVLLDAEEYGAEEGSVG